MSGLRDHSDVRRSAALDDFVVRRTLGELACSARAKHLYGASRLRMVAHLIDGDELAVIHHRGRLRFAARWLCSGGSIDMIVIADPSSAGGICPRCIDRRDDFANGGGSSVYRLYSAAGELLYIGSTANQVAGRMSAHAGKATWWPEVDSFTTEHFHTVLAARAAEVRAIRAERPKYNIKDATGWAS